MRPWHRGQLSTSTAKLRASNSAHGHYAPARSGVPLSSLLAGISWGGTIRDLHRLAGASTPAYRIVWKRGGGSPGADLGQFQSIAGIAADREYIYVVDHQVTPVQMFDRRGNPVRGWGKHDMGAQSFSLPEGIALDSKGRVIVVDALRHEIKFFDREGNFLDGFGGLGPRPGQVAFPADVAVDAADRIYVAEKGNNRVQVFVELEGR